MSSASFTTKALSVLAALTVASSSLLATAPAHALANARNVTGSSAPSDAIVRLHIGATACSATMITSTWALTARHCIPESGNAGAAVGSSTFSPFQPVAQAIIHPTADLALVELPHQGSTVDFYGSHVQPGEIGRATGWGGYAALGQKVAQEADVQIQRRVVNVPSPDRSAVMLEGTVTNGRLMPGDSGGPLYIGGQLAGVLSMSTSVENAAAQDGTVGWYVPVAEYTDWISRYTGKQIAPIVGTPAPVVDATEYPTAIPAPQPYTGSTIGGWAVSSF
ncbi:trypsin-like serine protease [Corynebacterium suranareeae]|uniref:Trypsin-like serine protease n=1 Tax=Corynebacterium suranareeae TaxID=2506452 RepID=A0A160PPS0_9CORY|nr:S1 family peptidase [Corynebacterium suranareeae]BAU95474.1 trypsin-like serine protease [Corynebacterium suranareeae]